MAHDSVCDLFKDVENNMLSSFDGCDSKVPHAGEKGGIRERRVRDFLTDHLPRKYGVGSGHIIDKCGNVSLQEDIVIFDQSNCPLLGIDRYYQIFPCETVSATVEVKSRLDSAEVTNCLEHCERLQTLDRRARGDDLGCIPNFVFAYDSYDSKNQPPVVWAGNTFAEKMRPPERGVLVPHAVFCLRHRFVLTYDGPMRDGPTHYAMYGFDSGALLYFFSVMLHRISLSKTTDPGLFSNYGWVKGRMTEYDKDGRPIPIIGVGVGKGKRVRIRGDAEESPRSLEGKAEDY